MDQNDLLRRIVGVLEKLGLQYYVTGSMASMYFGEMRYTNDVDVVVDLSLDRLTDFCREFPPDECYVSEDAARAAIRTRGMFNIIFGGEGLKVDVIIPEPTEFNLLRMRRAIRLRPAPDYEATFGSPEDVILEKLDFYREGGSEKHLRDIASMVKILGDELDMAYIEQWAQRLDLTNEWHVVQQRAGGPPNV
jgi:hypothetical protein